MKSLFSTCAAFALAGALFAPAALAQQTVVTPQQEQAGLPSGPYLLSCTNPHRVNGSLVALCDDRVTATQDAMDTWHMAQMPLAEAQQCNGAVADMRNGRLTCATMPMVGSSMPPQNYGSSFGTSEQEPMTGPGMAPQSYGNALGTSPYVPPYAANTGTSAPGLPGYQYGAAPGYPNGQPETGSSMMPENYGTSGAPYGYTTGSPNYLNQNRVVPGANENQPIGFPGTPSNPT
jgi:hypothetical protein